MNINQLNVNADKLTYGKWSELNQDYFANPDIIDEFYNFFSNARPLLPKTISIIEFGSAEGIVGEYFAKALSKNHKTELTLVDVVPEHLHANKNLKTIKICKDVLQFGQKEKYDLALIRSLLHYFSPDDQLNALKIIHESLKKRGYLLVAAFIQRPESLDLFLKLNLSVGKQLQLLSVQELENLFAKSGFTDIKFLGDATIWNCSSNNLKARYNLSPGTIKIMREFIKSTPAFEQKGFTLTQNGFTIPIPYKIYLLRKK